MNSSYRIPVVDDSQVGSARRAVQDICGRIGADETWSGKAAVIATELANNLVRHGRGGELILREAPGATGNALEFLAVDGGPGIKNIGMAMQDGYSTIGTAGTGLGSLRRMADRFEIFTQQGKGTVAWAYLNGGVAKTGAFEIGGVSVALEGEDVCGDAWEVSTTGEGLRVIVADGLGHGAFADVAAREAVAVFRKNATRGPGNTLEMVHLALEKTRGAAGAMVQISTSPARLTSAGVGNIAMRLVRETGTKSLVSDNGTLGASVRRVSESTIPWTEETLLVLHSDGLGSQWSLGDYPGLFHRHPSVIAGVLYRDYRRERDDVSVVVIKELP